MSSLNQALRAALEYRQDLLAELHSQGTDCYRLFHGSQEGAGGLTIDRYGPQLMVQSFHQSLEREALLQLHESSISTWALTRCWSITTVPVATHASSAKTSSIAPTMPPCKIWSVTSGASTIGFAGATPGRIRCCSSTCATLAAGSRITARTNAC